MLFLKRKIEKEDFESVKSCRSCEKTLLSVSFQDGSLPENPLQFICFVCV